MKPASGFALAMVTLGTMTLFACGGTELESRALDRDISVDGNLEEWEGVTHTLEDEKLSVGFLNDDGFLYVGLATADPRTQIQVLGLGFTLWFDPEGGKDKKMGIQFPLGARELGAMPRGERPDPAELYALHESMDPSMEILGEGEEEAKIPLGSLPGVEIALGWVHGTLVYELKIPLRDTGGQEFALGVESGTVVGVGMETPEINRDKMREEMLARGGGGMPGGGRGGGGGKGGGRMGGMDGSRPQPPEPIRFWGKVRIAEVAPQPADSMEPGEEVAAGSRS